MFKFGKTFLLLVSVTSSAFAVRCPNAPFTQQKCEEIRQDAVKVGCITPAIYNQLKAEARFPACVGANFVGDCPCGCFAPETLIDILSEEGGSTKALAASSLHSEWGKFSILALSDEAKVEKPDFAIHQIKNATVGEEAQPLVRIQLKDGRILRVTEKHPLLRPNGQMITARELTRGDQLVNRDGSLASIASIGRDAHKGKVYNFETNGSTLASHVIVAEGILTGDLAWQNSLEEELGGIAIRN